MVSKILNVERKTWRNSRPETTGIWKNGLVLEIEPNSINHGACVPNLNPIVVLFREVMVPKILI